MKPIDLILTKLNRVRQRSASAWIACCPAHDDRSPSLAIAEAKDGRILMNCYAGCDIHAIAEAMGLQVKDLFPDDYKPTHHEIDLSHEYLILKIMKAAKERKEHLTELDLNRAELALHRITTVNKLRAQHANG